MNAMLVKKQLFIEACNKCFFVLNRVSFKGIVINKTDINENLIIIYKFYLFELFTNTEN